MSVYQRIEFQRKAGQYGVGNCRGFTLMELMITIAIIGILAAIAIPNFIAYRNKSYCRAVELDADSVLDTLADHFAIPENTTLPTTGGSVYLGYQLSNKGGQNTVAVAGDPSNTITITATDGSRRCDTAYKAASAANTSAVNKWTSASSDTFTKYME